MFKHIARVTTVVVLVGVGLVGCGKKSAGAAAGGHGAMPPPAVRVLETKMESASQVRDFIAHVEPIQQVQLMSQVEGVIDGVHFEEGSRVEQGDLLFTIDPAAFQATVKQLDAELAQQQAMLDRAEKYMAMLTAADGRSISQSEIDNAEADVAEGLAAVHKAEASLNLAKIDLGYTKITAPISGRIGRALITKGNLVSPSSGPLATVIQIDPIRVVIAMPDAEYMTAFQRYSSDPGYNPLVKVRLANGTLLPAEGEIAFDDNQMDRATGTIAVRLRFPNADRMLVPNAYVNVLVQARNEPQRILLPAEAVLHGADGTFVWVVKDDNSVEHTPVEVGAVIGTQQIIESGLNPGQRVLYAGMQKVRPGMTVAPIEDAASE
jgi:membrane fusion protein (multidrug efflux system)